MSKSVIEWLAVAVPAVYLGKDILRGGSTSALGWALFAVPVFVWGVLTLDGWVMLLAVVGFVFPFVLYPRRRGHGP